MNLTLRTLAMDQDQQYNAFGYARGQSLHLSEVHNHTIDPSLKLPVSKSILKFYQDIQSQKHWIISLVI